MTDTTTPDMLLIEAVVVAHITVRRAAVVSLIGVAPARTQGRDATLHRVLRRRIVDA